MAIDRYPCCVDVLYDNPLDKYKKHISKFHLKYGTQKLKASSCQSIITHIHKSLKYSYLKAIEFYIRKSHNSYPFVKCNFDKL